MAAKRDNSLRRRPYCYVTWLTKLLAGENKCWYSTWFKVNHDYAKTPDDPDREAFFADWTARHDALVEAQAEQFKKMGYTLKMEEDAAFFAHGAVADVSGKPDLVAMRDNMAIVVDGKAGKRRKSDHWQVLIYMLLLPITWLQGYKIEGEVLYSDERVPVRALGAAERDAIVNAIKRVSAPEAPPAVPGTDCRYCDVAACTYRKVYEPPTDGDATRLF